MRTALISSLLTEVAERFPDVNLKELEIAFSKVLTSWHVERTGTEVAVVEPGLPRAARDYLTTRSIEGLSRGTLTTYRRVLERFFRDVDLPFPKIDATVIKLWLYRLQQSGVAMRTVAFYRTVVSTFFKWCEDNDVLQKSPARRVAPVKYDKPKQHALTPSEMSQIREACRNVRERTLVELLYSTGCRVGELVAMKRSDINVFTRTATAYNFKSRHEKTVFLSEACVLWLNRYLPTLKDDRLFPARTGGSIGIGRVEQILREIGERAGLPAGRLHPHILRHTLATDVVVNGGSLADAQHILDHRRPDTTLIYAEMSTVQLQETHRRCAA